MLYDKRWDKKTKADPLTLDSLVAWLELQPQDQRYDYLCTGTCMLAQYFEARGFKEVVMAHIFFYHGGRMEEKVELPSHFNTIAQGHPRTFGAALNRARTFAA